jgi:hypothetical protein
LAVKEFGGDLGQDLNQSMNGLVKILTSPSSADFTLQQRVDELGQALTDNASNAKLKKMIKEYIQNNSNKKSSKNLPESLSNKPEPISPQS